jgi:hypothetical protein
MTAGDQSYDSEPDRFGLAFNYDLNCALQPLDLLERTCSSATSNGFNIPHGAVCILHWKYGRVSKM